MRFVSRVEPRMVLVLFMLLWSAMAWAMFGMLAYGLISEPMRFPELVVFLVALLMAAVLSTCWIFWQLRGREVIEMNDEALRMWREGSLFKHQLSLRLEEVEFIQPEVDRDTPWWVGSLWALGGGGLVIGHHGRKRRWGIDLDHKAATNMAHDLDQFREERLAKRK